MLSRIDPEAVDHFLLGEEAFARDAWLTAERHYLRAFRLDSSFVLAGWRLGNARRWLPLRTGPPYPPGLYRLYQANRDAVPPVDRHLIEAQFQPSGAARFEQYERAMLVASDDPYAPLLYGDELFHRGPLAGRPLRDAVLLLERALAIDSTLAPAWEHLAWALIRQGEGERAGAALSRLRRWAAPLEESEIHLPTFLRLAYAFRFGDSAGQRGAMDTLSRDPAALTLAARGALSFDLPHVQAALGAALAASGAPAGQRASGLVARAVALVALGRPADAQASFDSAGSLLEDAGEARLQAAEWRVVPAALGAPGWSESERQLGRTALRAMMREPEIGVRAAWALALDAHSRGATAEAAALGASLRRAGRAEGLRLMLAGLAHAARGDWPAALEATEPALAFDSAGHAPDPFFRAALHLGRGEWLARSGRAAEADRAWLWYENLDVEGWPDAEAQPAEVDWALGSHARSLRARLALERGATESGCALARRVAELWADAEPAVAHAAGELAAMARECPP